MGEECFCVMLFIVLAILIYQSSGCVHGFPPSNKVGFSVIYFLWTVLGNQQRKMPMVYENDEGVILSSDCFMAPVGAPCFTVYNKFMLFLYTPNRCSLEKRVENKILF